MMIETRATLEAMPQKRLFNASSLPCEQVAKAVKSYWDDCQEVSPDAEAINFYGANHLAMLVAQSFTPNETLPPFARDALALYRRVLAAQSNRMFNYMLLITTRESRHVKHTSKFPALENSIKEKQGDYCMEFNAIIDGSNSIGAAQKFCSSPPKGELGPYVHSLERIFFEGNFSGGYGGKPWGEIAATLRRCIKGDTSLETMVDTAYTLAHNNGPIFNKGMMYKGYTSKFLEILDVQRAGQIPNALVEGVWDFSAESTVELCNLVKVFREEMPEKIGTYVDWFAVQAAGAVGHYGTKQKDQAKKYPKNMLFGSGVAAATTLNKDAAESAPLGYYQVDHAAKVKIISMKRSKA